jgi:sulfoxide reductase heme-binding subunit YedZ
MKKRKINFLKILVHIAAWSLVAWLTRDYLTGNLTVNPIQVLTQRTGKYALIFLVATLSLTPLNTLLGWRKALTLPRMLGLYTFMFAMVHMLIVVGLDYGFDWRFLWGDLANKRYIWVGLITLTILTLLAATSFRWWMKRLGKNWKRLHRLVYLAGPLVILHYAWSKKGDLLQLRGDVFQPLAFGVLVALLLIVRIPAVRKRVSELRNLLMRRFEPKYPSYEAKRSALRS